MPKVGFKHSEETKRKISEAKRGNSLGVSLDPEKEAERRRKISESMMGNQHTKGLKRSKKWVDFMREVHRGNTYFKGLKHTDEAKQKIREGLMGNKNSGVGESNHAWKGGINPLNKSLRGSAQFEEWRRIVFIRDGYECQSCGFHGTVHAHHIKPFAEYPELRFDPANGITYCDPCHRAIHVAGRLGIISNLIHQEI